MTTWHKDISHWEIGSTLYLSVPFTWLLPRARQLALLHSGPVQAGGPAVQLMPEFLADVAAVNQPCPYWMTRYWLKGICKAGINRQGA